MQDQNDTISLSARIQAGDHTAESELVERYGDSIRILLRRICRDESVADDVYQETFTIVLTRLRGRGIEKPACLAGFLYKTARNQATVFYRRRRIGAAANDEVIAQLTDPAPPPLDLLEIREMNIQLRRAIDELPIERDRQLLNRYYLMEDDKGQICTDLNLDDMHFHRVLFRARRRLICSMKGSTAASHD